MDQYSFEDRPDQIRLQRAWEQVLKRVGADVPAMWLERFLRPLRPISLQDGKATLIAPGKFVHEWVQQKYLGQLERQLSDELGEDIVVDLVAKPRAKDDLPVGAPREVVSTSKAVPQAAVRFHPNPRFTFENFVVGQSNRLAHAGALAVAGLRTENYNPLFIYGPSGLGKTHLLHSIASEWLARDPSCGIGYVTAQQFTEEFVYAIQNGKVELFRRSLRNVQIWLIDDVQFIAKRDKTQEELFHTFNHLQQSGRQIVITSDRPPRDLMDIEDRLRTRFESGLVADIMPPDTETRCAILLSKAEQESVPLTTEVALFLAENVPGNVRVLEGALTRLAAQASIAGQDLSLEVAQNLIESHYRSGPIVKPSFVQILNAVSKQYDIPVERIRGKKRDAPIVLARHVAVYVTREMTGDSWKHIGMLFGDRDHTSMMHGYRKISEQLNQDKSLRMSVRAIIRNLQTG